MARTLAGFLLTVQVVGAAALVAYPEFQRPDPFGGVVEADRGRGATPMTEVAATVARAGHVSFHLAAAVSGGGEYRLRLQGFGGGLQAKLYREWYHYLPASKGYVPDALIPVNGPYASRMPEKDNGVAGQKVQGFWVDVWVPAGTAPGEYRGEAVLEAGGKSWVVGVRAKVEDAVVPTNDVVTIDHNSYGTSWLASDYPALRKRLGGEFFSSDAYYRLIQSYHRIFYEHRGVFHQLGYGHGGKVGPEFAPRLEGTGKTKHVADWSVYDRHYGPLFDGSAFKDTERGARPIPYVYLPINPEWPASFLWWGEPGYEREFVNVVGEMERHFRDKGWTSTRFEVFFNQKKRYKGFPWDGDETRFARDYDYFKEYARLMKLAVPADSPVQFVMRTDASWTMERQFKELAGIIRFWVVGGGMTSWYREAVREVKRRGDIVWVYGGTPPVTQAAATIAADVVRPWMQEVDGFVHWQTVAAGEDPWFKFGGGGETLVYSGDRFGIAGPVPSIRLKIQRNVAEDLALAEGVGEAGQPGRDSEGSGAAVPWSEAGGLVAGEAGAGGHRFARVDEYGHR